MNSSGIKTTPLATSVNFTDNDLIVDLADARKISIPLVWFPRLFRATPEQRAQFEFLGDGEGVHWLQINEDFSVEGLFAGNRSPR